jgi:hypothetical protein
MVVSGSDARAVTPVKSGGLETATTGADEVETASGGADVVAVTGQVTDVCKDTFWPIVKAAGPKLVVLDMYTQWYRANSISFTVSARLIYEIQFHSHIFSSYALEMHE